MVLNRKIAQYSMDRTIFIFLHCRICIFDIKYIVILYTVTEIIIVTCLVKKFECIK